MFPTFTVINVQMNNCVIHVSEQPRLPRVGSCCGTARSRGPGVAKAGTQGRTFKSGRGKSERKGDTQSLRADSSLKAGSWFLLGPASNSVVGIPKSTSFSDLASSTCFISAAKMEAHLHLQITWRAVLGEKLLGSESLTVVLR